MFAPRARIQRAATKVTNIGYRFSYRASVSLKSVYLIATRDLSNLWLQFFYLKIKGLCDFLRKRF